jgi:phosphoribosylanthranilate isomerase
MSARLSTKVKICGVTEPADARFAADAGAWAIGVNFWPRSKRCVGIDLARQIATELAGAVLLVGVFVDAGRDEIARAVEAVPLDAIQLHGDESAADCQGWGVPVIKALRLRDRAAWTEAGGYPADFILVDAYVAGEAGGTGRRAAVEWIGPGMRDRLILAGGLDPDNVAAAIRAVAPFAVDVATGVESSPGHKDREKVKRFIENAHHA